MLISAWSYRDRAALVAGLLVPAGVAAVLVPLRASLPNTDAALVLVAVIVAVASNGHRPAGILAAASAAVWFDFFLTQPYQQFAITHRTDLETTVLLLLVGAAVTELAVRSRRNRVLAVTDQEYLSALGATVEFAGTAPSAIELARSVRSQLVPLLGLKGCRFERSRFGGLPQLTRSGQVRWNERVWDTEQYGMPASDVELLAEANGRAYGRFVLETVPGRSAPVAARRVAAILASQVGAALAHEARVSR